ncbi:AAA family ATPase [Candidatus Peregrinibacteria bacterium]|jgi:dephospho-CoA kinase|nr:AAA family ATPase [Candidatus Peregrinibacteria bacterium]
MKKIIIGFVGEIASGKGTACDYLIENHKAGSYRFSTIMRDILDRLHLPQSRKNMQQLSTNLRQIFEEDLFAKVIANDVKQDDTEIICVDGIRRPADIVYLKELDNFHLIHIYTDEKLRYNRIIERAENSDDKNKTFEEFLKDQLGETELTIPEVVAQADRQIKNNGNKEDLNKELEKLVQELKS